MQTHQFAPIPPPDGSRLCLLSLDGGGVRALSSLLILRRLMERVDPQAPPKPCDYFDMIGGTSTGGLIAIMLGRLEMDIAECIAAYEKISHGAFTKKHFSLVNHQGHTRPRFDTAALEAGIRSVIIDRGLDPDTALLKHPGGKCKTFVCATIKENCDTVVLTTYNSPRSNPRLYHNTLIWQAVRATAAATAFFDHIEFCDTTFIDGATGANNPAYRLWTEAGDQWQKIGSPRLETQIESLISIGTGVPSSKPFGDDLVTVAATLKHLTIETELTAKQFQRDRAELGDSDRLFRFNITHGLENIGLEDATRRKEIATVTESYLAQQTTYRALDICAATLKQRHAIAQIRFLTAKAADILNPLIRTPTPVQNDPDESQVDIQWLELSTEYRMWLDGNASRYLALIAEAKSGKTRFLHHVHRIFSHMACSNNKSNLGGLAVYIPCRRIRLAAYPLVEPLRRRNTGHAQSGLRNTHTVAEADNEDDQEERDGPGDSSDEGKSKWLPSHRIPYEHKQIGKLTAKNVGDIDKSLFVTETSHMNYVTILRMILVQIVYQKGHNANYLRRIMKSYGGELQSPFLHHLFENDSEQTVMLLFQLIQVVVRDLHILSLVIAVDELESLMHHDRLKLITMLNELPNPQDLSGTRFQIIIASGPEANISGILDGYLVVDRHAELQTCLRSLHFKEMYMRRDRVASSSKGTNLWIWNHKEFRSWTNASSSILWIEGKAGCGKSTLAKEIQNHLQLKNSKLPRNAPKSTITGFQSPVVTDHFYSARQLETGVSHELMLRSIVYQILRSDESLFRDLQVYYRSIQPKINESGGWSWEQLERTLEILKDAKGPSQNVICIIDAMDESKQDDINERHRTRVLRLLQRLCVKDKPHGSAATPKLNFKFIVLSRPAREIARELQKCHRIQMHVENRGDIRLLIEQGLRELETLMKQDDMDIDGDGSDSLCETEVCRPSQSRLEHQNAEIAEKAAINEIRTHLVERASGVTLWVLLILGKLRQLVSRGLYSFSQLNEQLKKLPEDLLTLYRNMASELEQKLDQVELERAKSLLLWISFASRPLQLAELWEAAAIPLSRQVSDFSEIITMRAHRRDANQLWLGMLEICGSFIDLVHDSTLSRQVKGPTGHVARDSDTVQLLHQSVKEFFIRPEAGAFRVLPEDVVKLKDACWTYANVALPIGGLSSWGSWTEQDSRSFLLALNDRPLLLYAFQSIKNERFTPKDRTPIISFLREIQVFALFADRLEIWDFYDWRHEQSRKEELINLYQYHRTKWFVIGCQLKTESTVRLLLYLLRSPGHGALGQEVSTMLVNAVEKQDYRFVELIRQHPMFDFEPQQGNPTFNGSSFPLLEEPLMAAVKRDDLRMVKCLIEGLRGRLYFRNYPLHLAVECAGVELADFIIKKTVAVDTLWEERAPLDVALLRGWDPMIKLLHSMGAKTAEQQADAHRKFMEHRASWLPNEISSGPGNE